MNKLKIFSVKSYNFMNLLFGILHRIKTLDSLWKKRPKKDYSQIKIENTSDFALFRNKYLIYGQQISLKFPGMSLPGTNILDKDLTENHPTPVVLVHGTFGNQSNNWSMIAPLLHEKGYNVFSLTYGTKSKQDLGGMTKLENNAKQVGNFIRKVMKHTGVSEVDIIAHSQGTLLPQYYINNISQDTIKIRKYISLGPLWKGTGGNLSKNLLRIAKFFNITKDDLRGFESLGGMMTGSHFLKNLNCSGRIYSPNTEYWNISTKYDNVIIPYKNGQISGSKQDKVHNIVLQKICKDDKTGHVGLVYSDRIGSMILDILESNFY